MVCICHQLYEEEKNQGLPFLFSSYNIKYEVSWITIYPYKAVAGGVFLSKNEKNKKNMLIIVAMSREERPLNGDVARHHNNRRVMWLMDVENIPVGNW